MTVTGSGRRSTALLEARGSDVVSRGPAPARAETLSPLALRVRGEFQEMPGLRLTILQAARLFGVVPHAAREVLERLERAAVLSCSPQGTYALASREFASNGESTMPVSSARNDSSHGSLRIASADRLTCLFRHWTWADEAMERFEHKLANGWNYDDDPAADHPFGAYYHWCALLCGFGEAALHHGLLPGPQFDAIRADLEASLPGLRACRQLLVRIPASVEEHPRIADLLRDDEGLARLRRLHDAIGQALREEQMSREIDLLDP